MSKFRSFTYSIAAGLLLAGSAAASADDAAAGKKVFKKCTACHAVGVNAKNRVGPQLNDLFGRTAGTAEGYKFSKAMKSAGEKGLIWNAETITELVIKPKKFVKGTKMAFAGLKKENDRTVLVAYLKTFSSGSAPADAEKPEATGETQSSQNVTAAAAAQVDGIVPEHGAFHLGRKAYPEEIAAWDIDIRPDGTGLPKGRGTVAQGEPIYAEICAVCHGDFGEGVDRWPVLTGGHDTLTEERPEKTIGSYWPYLSTVFDYVRRAMPFGNARSLSHDEVYAITAYLLYANDVVTDEDFELSHENFTGIRLPNEANFIADNRMDEAHYSEKKHVCMTDCKPEPVKVIMRARILDVTPDSEEGDAAGVVD